jgi:hypothetical protein
MVGNLRNSKGVLYRENPRCKYSTVGAFNELPLSPYKKGVGGVEVYGDN